MVKKISRRNFLKGAGKTTAALAAIWMVEFPSLTEVEEEPDQDPIEETEEEIDTWNEACHPYFCDGGVSIRLPLSDHLPFWLNTSPEVKQ